jgi:hypothetical protein
MDGRPPGDRSIDPAELLRGALEKIVFFECRVSQLESELRAAVQTAERASGDASSTHRKAVELEGALAAVRGARDENGRRAAELTERVRLLEGERERLLAGLVEQARVSGAPGSAGDDAGDQADLAGFIAELRGELEELRRFKAGVEGASASFTPAPAAAGTRGAPAAHASVGEIAGRLSGEGRVGISARDAGSLRGQLKTETDRVLFEEAVERLRAVDPAARLRAVQRLEALGPKTAAPLLAAAVGREQDAEVKAALLGALGRVGEPFASDIAAAALSDRSATVRGAALDALSRLAPDAAEHRVLGALADESPFVRRRAALLLACSKSPQADEALAAALRDGDSGVARAAAAALAGRPSAEAQRALAHALEHADVRVRRSAAETLGRWTGELVDGDAPDHERRRAARRIAEKLAAMAPAEVRSAVVGAAEKRRPSGISIHRFSGRSPGRATVPASASAPRSAPASAAAKPKARVAVVASVASPLTPALSPAGEGERESSPLESSILAELRAALRGRGVAELAELLSAPAAQVEAELSGLAARGAAVARGPRWYVG